MYKQIADYQFHQTIEWLERAGEGWIMYLAQTGFLFFEESAQIRWELEWLWTPCALYIEPRAQRAVAWFRDQKRYGVIDLANGQMETYCIPECFSEDWFSNLYYWQGEELFLYSAESDVVALNVSDQSIRYSRYEEAPLFGEVIELSYQRTYDFEHFTPQSYVTLYDAQAARFLIQNVETNERWQIPYSGDRDTTILDQVGETTAITSSESFQLYSRDEELFRSGVCTDYQLIKVMLLDDRGDRLVVLSAPSRFCHSWLQVFERSTS